MVPSPSKHSSCLSFLCGLGLYWHIGNLDVVELVLADHGERVGI